MYSKVTEFNTCLQFVRSESSETSSKHHSSRNRSTANNHGLRVNTDPLGITYDTADNYYDGIFRYNECQDETVESSSYSPPDRRPSLLSCSSPTPSPSSSTSSSNVTSPIAASLPTTTSCFNAIGISRRVPRNKCQLTRRESRAFSNSVSSPISAKSWDHIQSPAASFLASFASPTLSMPPQDEEEGDEIDDYVLEQVIGYGGFSTVRRGYCISDGHRVAIKVIKKSMMAPDEVARLERELSIWKSLDHAHIVRVEKILETDHAMYIVCTYCGGGSLLEFAQRRGPNGLPESEVRRIVLQLAKALAYLHEDARVCHKDIKLDNVLLTEQEGGQIMLCDFGLALYEAPHTCKHEPAGGSLAYAAPEQVLSPLAIPSPATDMWSLGVVIYALIAGRLPFQDEYDARLQQKILDGQYELPEGISPELEQLLNRLMHKDPQERYTIRQVLESPWCQVP